MKELTIQEKAEAYDRALEAVKRLREVNPSDEGIQRWVNENFPELEESKDEKIIRSLKEIVTAAFSIEQKEVLVSINELKKDDLIAWLEKQGQKETTYDEDMLGAIEYCKKNNRPLEKEHIDWIEKQGKTAPEAIKEENDLYKNKKVMITEDYVSFEVAKLLKEKGFNESCHATYDTAVTGGKPKFSQYEAISFFPYGIRNTDDKYSMVISAPTHQMAMKWLREVYHIFIEISTSIDLNGNYHSRYTILDKECKYIRRGYTDFDWEYKDACDAAIKYCLENLI